MRANSRPFTSPLYSQAKLRSPCRCWVTSWTAAAPRARFERLRPIFATKTTKPSAWHQVTTHSDVVSSTYGLSLSSQRHISRISTMAQTNGTVGKPVLFVDIDNCLYPRSTKVQDLMAKLIDEYFAKHLELSMDDAIRLHSEYYTNYGLALEGLVRHHQIDPLEYNAKVDDALPLEGIIKPNPELRALIQDIDKSKVKIWLFTNAYVNHAKRVVKLLGIDDLFDGLTYCDYSKQPLICKPHVDMFKKGMKEAGIDNVENCYFVDDSALNCRSATEFGWTVAHLVEEGIKPPSTQAAKFQISHITELRKAFPQFFKSTSD